MENKKNAFRGPDFPTDTTPPVIGSHSVSHATRYFYPIVSGDYIERDSKTICKPVLRKGAC